jgi:hypothetical protein
MAGCSIELFNQPIRKRSKEKKLIRRKHKNKAKDLREK